MPSSSGVKDKLYYGWVLVIAFFIYGVVAGGIRISFGVFFKSIQNEFDLSRATTSLIVSLSMFLGFSIFAFLGGWALDRYGPRIVVFVMGLFTGLSLLLTSQTNSTWQLFITYSLLLAIGSGAMFVVPMSTVSRWFDKKRGLAVGITGSGSGLGQVIIAPLATFLIARFDWRIAYIAVGLLTLLIVVPISRLLKREPREIGLLPDGVKLDSVNSQGQQPKTEENSVHLVGLSLNQAFRTRSFWLCGLCWLSLSFCLLLVATHIVPHATDLGFSDAQAAIIISIIGGSAIAGRVLMGILADKIGRRVVSVICFLIQAGAMLWLLWGQDLWMLYVFALVYGFANGGLHSAVAALVSDIFGLRKIGTILGVLETGFATGAALGPYIGGLIFDNYNSYSVAFLVGAATMVVGAIIIALTRRETGRVIEDGQN